MKKSTAFSLATASKEITKPAFGIDLGTTNSCIAVVGNSDNPKIVKLLGDRITMPSCVMWNSNKVGTEEEFIVGEEAYEKRYKSNVCYSVKRKMGTGEVIKFIHNNKKITKTPAEVSALILKELVRRARDVYKDIEDVVITVPASFMTPQIQDTTKAAELAGLKVLNILKEPTAASLVYKLDKTSGNALVYDLGGGTFDVSVVSISKSSKGNSEMLNLLGINKEESKDVITVLASEGDPELGGDDLDNLMYKVVESKLRDLGCDVTKINPSDREELILRLESFKKYNDFAYIDMDIDLILKDGKPFKDKVTFSKEDYQECTRILFERTKPFIDKVVRTSKISIDYIVLVGGSTKNKHLVNLLEKEYKEVEIYKYLNPDESVALGAAIQAKRVKFGSDTLEVFDVISSPIGVLADGRITRLVDKNQSIPFTGERIFSTTFDNQESVSIEIYEGSGIYPEENCYLGNLSVSNLPKGKAGTVGVTVAMSIDSNGLLSCRAKVDKQEWKSIELVNLLGRKVESFSKSSSVMYDRWYKLANSLEEPRRSELISLIDEARVSPNAEKNVVKFINKVLIERKNKNKEKIENADG